MTEEAKIVYVGKNPPLTYASEALALFHDGASEVSFKARGFLIYKAVEAEQKLKTIFMPKVKSTVKTGLEVVTDRKTGQEKQLPTIEIIMKGNVKKEKEI